MRVRTHPRGVALGFIAYAALNKAYDEAPLDRRSAMKAIAGEAASRRQIYSMSRHQRDRFLAAGGYCRWSFEPGCAPLPGADAQHWLDGRERLAGLLYEGRRRCDPRRCGESAQ